MRVQLRLDRLGGPLMDWYIGSPANLARLLQDVLRGELGHTSVLIDGVLTVTADMSALAPTEAERALSEQQRLRRKKGGRPRKDPPEAFTAMLATP